MAIRENVDSIPSFRLEINFLSKAAGAVVSEGKAMGKEVRCWLLCVPHAAREWVAYYTVYTVYEKLAVQMFTILRRP